MFAGMVAERLMGRKATWAHPARGNGIRGSDKIPAE
jgi:hypothetical protein